jgi:hypothetical protein
METAKTPQMEMIDNICENVIDFPEQYTKSVIKEDALPFAIELTKANPYAQKLVDLYIKILND